MSDLEKQPGMGEKASLASFEQSLEDASGQHGEADEIGLNIFDKWAKKLRAETRGVDMVPEEEKVEDSLWEAASMWLSANLVIATFSLGALGVTVWGLSFFQCIMVIIFFSLLGAMPVAFFSIFGCRFGLRQMILSKFLLGDFGMRIFAFINIVACVGWGAVNIMASAQLLHIVNNGALPPWAGCLIIVICTILVTFFGYKVIHTYEKWSWIVNAACFIAVICRMAMSGNFTWGTTKGGETTAGNVLSFGGAIFGFASGWTTYASDYTVYQPRDANALKIFFAILTGLMLPLVFTLILGAACATGTLTDPAWAKLYESDSIGGLVYAILVTDSLHGFGQFLCVLLGLSTVANNIPNMYSIAMSAQAFWSPLRKVPRVIWTILGNFVTLAICIPGYYHFSSVMSDFMNLISYYLAIYEAMCLSEHFIWRRANWANYDYENYNDRLAYPIGFAGVFGFCCGVAGVVIGMDQGWYAGVAGRKIGAEGGDIGFEMGAGFAFVGFNVVRAFEKRYIGR